MLVRRSFVARGVLVILRVQYTTDCALPHERGRLRPH